MKTYPNIILAIVVFGTPIAGSLQPHGTTTTTFPTQHRTQLTYSQYWAGLDNAVLHGLGAVMLFEATHYIW